MLSIVTEPTIEPISVPDCMEYLNYTNTDDRLWFELAIKSAREYFETQCSRAIVQQTWKCTLSKFSNEMELQLSPLISVSQIEYIDLDGNTQTLATSVYDVDTLSSPFGRILLGYDQQWPNTRKVWNAVQITFTAGYAPSNGSPQDFRANIPRGIITALVALVGSNLENREADAPVKLYSAPAAQRLLQNYWIKTF